MDAVDLGFVQRVELVTAWGLLVQQMGDQGELHDDSVPQGAFGDVLQVAMQVAHYPASVALQLFQCLALRLNYLAWA